jgi:fluoride exporter
MQQNGELKALLKLYGAIGCGSAVGSLLRFLSGYVVVFVLGWNAIFATAFVNVVGSFVIMFFATLTGPHGRFVVAPVGRQFVMAGLCGGFTTFSAMSLETFILMLDGDPLLAATNIISVIVLSLLAAWTGYVVAAWLNK